MKTKMKTKMTDNQTASAQYDDNIDALMELLDDIRAAVAMHNVRFDRDGRRSWGAVGDLGHIRNSLNEINAFLGNEEQA